MNLLSTIMFLLYYSATFTAIEVNKLYLFIVMDFLLLSPPCYGGPRSSTSCNDCRLLLLPDTSFTADSCINVVLCANDEFVLQELKEEREVIYPPPKKESESIVATSSVDGTEGGKSEAEGELWPRLCLFKCIQK